MINTLRVISTESLWTFEDREYVQINPTLGEWRRGQFSEERTGRDKETVCLGRPACFDLSTIYTPGLRIRDKLA